jgi:hypothetical protein
MNQIEEQQIDYKSPTAIGGVILFLVLLLWIGHILFKKYELSINKRYTIGTTLKARPTHKGLVIDYKYEVDSIEYRKSGHPTYHGPSERTGGRYFVEFLPTDPNINDILWDRPVPENITSAPKLGWKELP